MTAAVARALDELDGGELPDPPALTTYLTRRQGRPGSFASPHNLSLCTCADCLRLCPDRAPLALERQRVALGAFRRGHRAPCTQCGRARGLAGGLCHTCARKETDTP